jgi:hypothetical protein
MVCCAADIGDGTTVTVTSMYASTHTYLAMKSLTNGGYQNANGANGGTGSATPSAVLMRYE